jgi:hypothetical protein
MESEYCPICGQTLKIKISVRYKTMYRPSHKNLYCPNGCYSTVIENEHDKAIRVNGENYDNKLK